jgi:hypothetical protein
LEKMRSAPRPVRHRGLRRIPWQLGDCVLLRGFYFLLAARSAAFICG